MVDKLCFIYSLLFTLSPAQALTLEEALLKAQKTPRLELKQREKEILNVERKMLWGELLPTLNLSYQDTHQDGDGSLFGEDNEVTKLTLTQPLPQGLLPQKALKANNLSQEASQFESENTLHEIRLQLIDFYFSYSLASLELDLLKEEISLEKSRVKELSQRVKIGRSKEADLLSQEAQLQLTQNKLLEKELELKTLQLRISGLLGENTSVESLNQRDMVSDTLIPWEEVQAALKNHPSLKSLSFEKLAIEQTQSATYYNHFPSAQISSNYYLDRKQTTLTKDRDWDVSLNVSLPLFEGGRSFQETQKQIELGRMKTLEEQEQNWRLWGEWQNNYQIYLSEKKRLGPSKEIMDKEEKRLKLLHKEFTLGQLGHLEYLSATKDLYQARAQHYTLFFSYYKKTYLLKELLQVGRP